MSNLAQASLQRALEITADMIDAATSGNWMHVVELDVERQACLEQAQTGATGLQHRAILLALKAHNQTLMEHANLARETIEQQLGQHQYNHRALRTYINSSSSR